MTPPARALTPYAQGAAAAKMGKRLDDNPYAYSMWRLNFQRAQDWERGWRNSKRNARRAELRGRGE